MKEVPKKKKITATKQVEILQAELKRKDAIIEKLREENALLFKISLKNAKKKLEED